MDPGRKRALRMSIALSCAVLLAVALIYTSFSAGRDEVTAAQLVRKARPGTTYILAGTVVTGSVHRTVSSLSFRIVDPKSDVTAAVHYTGEIPDPFAVGRAVLVDVKEGGSPTATYAGVPNSLTTKCPSKYQVAAGAVPHDTSSSGTE